MIRPAIRPRLPALLVVAGFVAAGLVALPGGARAEITFDAEGRSVTSAAVGARSVHVVDLDGDGDRDVLSASYYDDRVVWYENRAGDASAWTAREIANRARGAACVVAADIDADGRMDVVSASQNDDRVMWYRNVDGPGRKWEARVVSGHVAGARAARVADVDMDGDLDIVTSAPFNGRIAWHENLAGDGSEWARRQIESEAPGVRDAIAIDVDGDGDTDVLASVFFGDRVTWYENRVGDGTAWVRRDVGGAVLGAISLAASDFDGDGDLDVVSAAQHDDQIRWHEQGRRHRSSVFERHHTVPTTASGARAVRSGDVDGDGDMDLLSASANDDRIAWYENTAGSGRLWKARSISTTANGASDVVAADLDGDGDLDAVSASEFDNKIAWHENRDGAGESWLEHSITTSANGARAVHAADIDGDGDLDVVTASANDDKVAWYENLSADGREWSERVISTTARGAFAVDACDLDGDGDLDVASASSFDDRIAWYENPRIAGADSDASGGADWRRASRWRVTGVSSEAAGASSVRCADVDGDGDSDLLSASDFDATVEWHRNDDARGASWTTWTITRRASGATSVHAADIDGDGDLDVVSASRFDDTIAWHTNLRGDGLAWRSTVVSASADGATAVWAADLDGDGDADVVSASREDDKIAWYENVRGDGSQLAERLISVFADGPTDVHCADLDRDGDLDVLSASRFDGRISWYENTDGRAKSWVPRAITGSARGATSVFAADLDRDGDLDVLSASSDDDRIAWYQSGERTVARGE